MANKRSTGVTPEVNLREYVTHTPLPNLNKAGHSGFETQRRPYQKSKTGLSVDPQKGLQIFFFFKKSLKCSSICRYNLIGSHRGSKSILEARTREEWNHYAMTYDQLTGEVVF